MPHKTYTAGEDELWMQISKLQGQKFQTAKRLEFSFELRNNEMFVSRKDKSITRATVNLAWHNALELGHVSGPKQLKTFGASYLYPIFLRLGIIRTDGQIEMELEQEKEERE